MHPPFVDLDIQSTAGTVASDREEDEEREEHGSIDIEESKISSEGRNEEEYRASPSIGCCILKKTRCICMVLAVLLGASVSLVITLVLFFGDNTASLPTINAATFLLNPGLALFDSNDQDRHTRAFHFGQSVAIHASNAIVCAPGKKDMIRPSPTESKHGSCSIFQTAEGNRWKVVKKSFGLDMWEFGSSVALADGAVLVGAPLSSQRR